MSKVMLPEGLQNAVIDAVVGIVKFYKDEAGAGLKATSGEFRRKFIHVGSDKVLNDARTVQALHNGTASPADYEQYYRTLDFIKRNQKAFENAVSEEENVFDHASIALEALLKEALENGDNNPDAIQARIYNEYKKAKADYPEDGLKAEIHAFLKQVISELRVGILCPEEGRGGQDDRELRIISPELREELLGIMDVVACMAEKKVMWEWRVRSTNTLKYNGLPDQETLDGDFKNAIYDSFYETLTTIGLEHDLDKGLIRLRELLGELVPEVPEGTKLSKFKQGCAINEIGLTLVRPVDKLNTLVGYLIEKRYGEKGPQFKGELALPPAFACHDNGEKWARYSNGNWVPADNPKAIKAIDGAEGVDRNKSQSQFKS